MTAELFGARVRDERNQRQWSQAELAKRLSKRGPRVYSTTVAKIEAGDRAIRVDELAALADVFGISVDTLLGRRARSAASNLDFALGGVLRTALQAASQAFIAYENLQERTQDLWDLIQEQIDPRKLTSPETQRLAVLAHQAFSAADGLEKAAKVLGTLAEDIRRVGLERAEKAEGVGHAGEEGTEK